MSQDPGAPTRPGQKELVLLTGFLLCVVLALVTVVIPELSSGDDAPQRSGEAIKAPKAAPAGPPPVAKPAATP